jgi:hypothetical protein
MRHFKTGRRGSKPASTGGLHHLGSRCRRRDASQSRSALAYASASSAIRSHNFSSCSYLAESCGLLADFANRPHSSDFRRYQVPGMNEFCARRPMPCQCKRDHSKLATEGSKPWAGLDDDGAGGGALPISRRTPMRLPADRQRLDLLWLLRNRYPKSKDILPAMLRVRR